MSLGRSAALAACGFLAAFGVLQLLSIGWAHARGDAWDAANRTFVYTLAFLLFVGWRAPARAKQGLVLLFGFGMAVLGVATLFSAANHVGSAFEAERLSAPTGYANATAALFLIPFWAVVSLGGTPRLPRAACGRSRSEPPRRSPPSPTCPESRGALYSFPVAVGHPARSWRGIASDRGRPGPLDRADRPAVHPLSRPFEAAVDPGTRDRHAPCGPHRDRVWDHCCGRRGGSRADRRSRQARDAAVVQDRELRGRRGGSLTAVTDRRGEQPESRSLTALVVVPLRQPTTRRRGHPVRHAREQPATTSGGSR